MEKLPSFVLKLPLEEMALRRVVVNLWNETDVLVSFENLRLKSHRVACKEVQRVNVVYYANDDYKVKKVIEDKVKDKVSKLVLPELLKKRMMHLVGAIGSEILSWQIYHTKFLSFSYENFHMRILEELCWTSTGVIDYRRTAEKLVRLEMFDAVKSYKLACFYCMFNYIPLFWKELPEKTKRRLYGESCYFVWEERLLESYWAHVLMGEEPRLDSKARRFGTDVLSFHQYAFEESARKFNKTATEYFLKMLTNEERNSSLFRTIHYVIFERYRNSARKQCDFPKRKLADVLCYLLSIMTPEEQMVALRDSHSTILCLLMDWPWQDCFLDVADVIWTFLPKDQYCAMLYNMIDNIRHSGCYFPNLIQEFFRRSPREFRKYFVNYDRMSCGLFAEFCHNTDTIKVVFRELDAEDRVRFVFGYEFYQLFEGLVMRNKWQLVELCLREASLSKKDRKIFFELLEISDEHQIQDGALRLKRFFEFLDKIEANSPSKRLGR